MAETAAAAKSPVATAADRIRETAKWLTVSLAALGGVLIAGSQLSDVGALEFNTVRFWLAVGGALLSILGTVAILSLAIWIATTKGPSFPDLLNPLERHTANTALVADRYRLGGEESIEALDQTRTAALSLRTDLKTAFDREQDPALKGSLAQRLLQADADFAYRDKLAGNVLERASYEVLAYRWRRVGIWMIVSGVSAAVGIGVFAWAANPPPDATASVVTPALLTAPTSGTLTLTAAGQQALADELGCPADKPLAVLRLGKTDAGTDVVIQESGCKTLRFIVVPAWGSVSTPPAP